MTRPFLFLVLLSLPLLTHAEKGQSIMFGDPDPLYTERTRDNIAGQQAEECMKLNKEIKALKGKPQRRNAAIQRYRLECDQNYQQPGRPLVQ